MYLDMYQEIKQTHHFFDEVIYELNKKIPLLSIEEQRILFYSSGEAMVLNSILNAQQQQLKEIFKLFFRVQKPNQLVISNAVSAYTQLQNEKGENLHGAILSKEIECVKPQAIITLGNPARNQLLTINHLLKASAQTPQKWSGDRQHYRWNNQTPIISAPHISGAAIGAKALVLNNPAYEHLEGKYQNEKLAKIIIEKLMLVSISLSKLLLDFTQILISFLNHYQN